MKPSALVWALHLSPFCTCVCVLIFKTSTDNPETLFLYPFFSIKDVDQSLRSYKSKSVLLGNWEKGKRFHILKILQDFLIYFVKIISLFVGRCLGERGETVAAILTVVPSVWAGTGFYLPLGPCACPDCVLSSCSEYLSIVYDAPLSLLLPSFLPPSLPLFFFTFIPFLNFHFVFKKNIIAQ